MNKKVEKYDRDSFDLAIDINRMFESLEGKESATVGCISNYEVIKQLVSDLIVISDGEIKLVNIELLEEDVNGYNKEYYLTLDSQGIWVQKAWNERHNRYFCIGEHGVFIDKETYAKVGGDKVIEAKELVVFEVCDEEKAEESNEMDWLFADLFEEAFYDDEEDEEEEPELEEELEEMEYLFADLFEEDFYEDEEEETDKSESEDEKLERLEKNYLKNDPNESVKHEETEESFSWSKTTENGTVYYSFYSTNKDTVKDMCKYIKEQFECGNLFKGL